jgi:hypothetical protein
MWNPIEHSDQENLHWAWLRAVEWGRWPIFLSQTIAPVLLIWLPWFNVVAGVFILNLIWALFIRYKFISAVAASAGIYVVLARWVTWPAATIDMFIQKRYPECLVALAWPVLILPLGAFTPVQIGRIQVEFMHALGYEPSDLNPLSGI